MAPRARPLDPAYAGRSPGFTLLEVLVALGIVAVALMAGLRSVGALTQQTQRHSDALLGQLCADNALTQMRLSRQTLRPGEYTQDCVQGAQVLQLSLAVQPTANPRFVRVDAAARRGGTTAYRVVALLRSTP